MNRVRKEKNFVYFDYFLELVWKVSWGTRGRRGTRGARGAWVHIQKFARDAFGETMIERRKKERKNFFLFQVSSRLLCALYQKEKKKEKKNLFNEMLPSEEADRLLAVRPVETVFERTMELGSCRSDNRDASPSDVPAPTPPQTHQLSISCPTRHHKMMPTQMQKTTSASTRDSFVLLNNAARSSPFVASPLPLLTAAPPLKASDTNSCVSSGGCPNDDNGATLYNRSVTDKRCIGDDRHNCSVIKSRRDKPAALTCRGSEHLLSYVLSLPCHNCNELAVASASSASSSLSSSYMVSQIHSGTPSLRLMHAFARICAVTRDYYFVLLPDDDVTQRPFAEVAPQYRRDLKTSENELMRTKEEHGENKETVITTRGTKLGFIVGADGNSSGNIAAPLASSSPTSPSSSRAPSFVKHFGHYARVRNVRLTKEAHQRLARRFEQRPWTRIATSYMVDVRDKSIVSERQMSNAILDYDETAASFGSGANNTKYVQRIYITVNGFNKELLAELCEARRIGYRFSLTDYQIEWITLNNATKAC